jgi:hypothetical protein
LLVLLVLVLVLLVLLLTHAADDRRQHLLQLHD